MKKRWGAVRYYKYYYKIKKAVDETRGQVLTYQGELIEPSYHSSCGGRTEDAADVWKFQAPYLKSVPCPYDADPNPAQTVSFSFEQVDQALGTSLSAVPVSGREKAAVDIQLVEKTGTGRPKVLLIGNRQFSAVAVRDQRRAPQALPGILRVTLSPLPPLETVMAPVFASTGPKEWQITGMTTVSF